MTALPRIEDFDDPSFDPHAAGKAMFGDREDTYQAIAALRRRGAVQEGNYYASMGLPAAKTETPRFMVLSYDAMETVLGHPEIYSNKIFATLGPAFGRTLTAMDAPEHMQYRKIFQKAFLPNIVQRWGRDFVEPVIDDLMAGFRSAGRADLLGQFTQSYPYHVVYRMLGLPREDIEIFHKLSITQILVRGWKDKALEASAKLGRYFQAMIDARRAHPGNDVVSALATVEQDGERLPDDVLVSFCRQLINAGGETTYHTTSVLLAGLLLNPEQLEAVRRDRALIPQAIEEGLRWEGPVVSTSREVTMDTELAGVKLPKGAIVDVVYGSANHDETRFADPERFDIFRPRQRHFGFALGPHICLGQHLARLEMTRAVNALLDGLPNLRLDPSAPAPTIHGAAQRVPRHLRVVFG